MQTSQRIRQAILMSNSRTRVILIVLLCACTVGALLRLYRVEELLYFNGDQGRDMTVVRQMIQTGQPALLGPGSGVGQFKRGPVYYYLLLPALWLGGGEPTSAAIFIALVDVATIVMVFVVGRALVSMEAGIAAALLYACAFVPILVARIMTNPSLLPFLTLLMLYSVWRMTQGNDLYFLLLVGAFIVALQLHEQVLLLLVVFALAWHIFKIRIRPRLLVFATGLGVLLFLPFIWYEATHNAENLRVMVDYVRSAGAERAGEMGVMASPDRVGLALLFLYRVFTDEVWLGWIWLAALVMSSATLLLRFRRETPGGQLLLLWALAPILYAFWPGPVYEVNLAIIMPLPFLLIGYGIDRLVRVKPRWEPIVLVVVLLVAGANASAFYRVKRTQQPRYDSYSTVRSIADRIVAMAGDRPIALNYVLTINYEELDSSLKYQLARRGAIPSHQPEAMQFRLFYPLELGAAEQGTVINDVKLAGYLVRGEDANLLTNKWQVLTPNGKQSSLDEDGSVLITSVSDSTTVQATQRLALEPNSDYLMKFECRNDLLRGDQRVYLRLLDAQGNWLDTLPSGAGYVCPVGKDWTRVALLVRTTAPTKKARILLQNRGDGKVWFRHVELRRAILEPVPGTR